MEKVLNEDIDFIANSFIFVNEIKDKTILITGSNGLIGSLLIRSLIAISKKYKININIYALTRNIENSKKIFNNSNIKYVVGDMTDNTIFDNIHCDYIIHAASPTQSSFLANNPVETIETNILGGFNVINLANKCKARILYISSIEVYGESFVDKVFSENESGYLNNLSPRSGYPESKKMIECLLSSYSKEYGLDAVICRLTQTFGPGIRKDDNRIFSYIAKCIINNNDIYIKTTGESAKPYIYSAEAIIGIFYILFRGCKGECYNLANSSTYVSIIEMCKIAIKSLNSNVSVHVSNEVNSGNYAPTTKINLDITKLSMLGFKPQIGLDVMYDRLVSYIKGE